MIIIQIIASFSTSLCAYRYIPGIKSIIFKFSLSYVCVQKELRFYSIPMYSGGVITYLNKRERSRMMAI